MDIVRIEKVNLVDAVYTQLRDLLVSGKWPEGTKIPSENELCKDFSVSRVVIREALQKLRGERLIVTRQGVGTYAANPSNFAQTDQEIVLSEQMYRDFLNFREAVEISAVKLTRKAATEEDYLRMEQCLEAMQAAYDTVEQYNLADYNFHLSVVMASHNEMLVRAMTANQNVIVGVFTAMNAVPDARDFGVSSHQQIVQNLREKKIKQVIDDYAEMGRYNLARLHRFFRETE
ncbi:MAG: FadR family transcriptional regulator [Oscillospiraceae bacterium]|nr:FadR family transcriptional regulator [Oscillospiraceae bacterium]